MFEIITVSGGDNLVKSLDILKEIADVFGVPIFEQKLSGRTEYIVFYSGERFVYDKKISTKVFDT